MLAVVTAADLPNLKDKIADLGEGAVNLAHLGANVLAHGKVLYKGHAVAAVAATSPHVAEEAAKLIKVEYEPLPAGDLGARRDEGRRAAAARRRASPTRWARRATKPSNVATHLHFEKGNVDEGFAEADVVVEREFKTASVHQGYIEPHVATALWNEDGHLTIWTVTQGAFTARQQTAELLQIPVSQVTVVPCEIGGGFGGKIAVYLEPVAAALEPQVRPAGEDDHEPRRGLRRAPARRPARSCASSWARRRTASSWPARPGWPTTPARFPAA